MADTLTRASARDTAAAVSDVLMPLIARGVIVRRPAIEERLDRSGGDRRAVARMQHLRDRYGPEPVLLRIPGRRVVLILDPEDERTVLDGTPSPFTPASREKRAALAHFQPRGALISDGEARTERRAWNGRVLQESHPHHELTQRFAAVAGEEIGPLAAGPGALDWDLFATAWWRLVRRIVLGDGARDDDELTDLLRRLRGDANWAFLMPRRHRLRARFDNALRSHLDRAEPGSLAELIARTPAAAGVDTAGQVPQWLFAFDAAGMASFRALALLAAHPDHADRCGEEDGARRAALLESVRLWPTTPAILRDTTARTEWQSGTLEAGATVVVFAPFFHRDDARLADADRFAPSLWDDGRADAHLPFVPFSSGDAICPGRNIVLTVGSLVIGELLRPGGVRQVAGTRLHGDRPLPGTLSPFGLRFVLGS